MTEEPNDEVRAFVHGMWAGVAPQWRSHAEAIDVRSARLTVEMLDAVAVGEGDRVLELACGPGGTGIAAAQRVGPEGKVVLSDVSEAMAAIAGERAAVLGLRNVATARLDLEDIEEPDATFDIVLCREGLMFAVDPARAVGELFRVLRPAGRVAVAVWGPRDENPWLGLLLDAVGAELDTPMPPPGIPGPFALADAEGLAELVAAAGFAGVEVRTVAVPHRSPSFDDYFALTSDLAGPLAAVLAGLPEDVRQSIAERLRSAVQPYTSAFGVDLPGVSLLVSAHRPPA